MSQKKRTPKLNQEQQQRLFEYKLAQKRKKQEKRIQSMKGKSIGRWNQEELKILQNNDLRRNQRIFKQMSKFINSRTPDQCRTHHQKNQRKWYNLINIIHNLSEQFGALQIKQILQQHQTLSIPTTLNIDNNLKIVNDDIEYQGLFQVSNQNQSQQYQILQYIGNVNQVLDQQWKLVDQIQLNEFFSQDELNS